MVLYPRVVRSHIQTITLQILNSSSHITSDTMLSYKEYAMGYPYLDKNFSPYLIEIKINFLVDFNKI